MPSLLTSGLLVAAAVGLANAASITLNVSSTPKAETIPYQYGLMFEDINHSGDGGLYAELIMNRAFQANSIYEATTDPWFPVNGSTFSLMNQYSLSSALPTSIFVSVPANSNDRVGLGNPGYWGIDVRPQKYTGSFHVMGAYNGYFYITLSSLTTGDILATKIVKAKSTSKKWTHITYSITPEMAAPDVNNALTITFDAQNATAGGLNFNLISLFPPTYKNRQNGMRPELMDALNQLSGSYLRFPGGNNIEGNGPGSGSGRWIWNQTIGPLKNRPGRLGTWGYYNTDGLGLAEYFQWCEDLDLEPVYAVWSGEYLDGVIIAEADLEPYIQEALNAIEYITGSSNTTYGALRAANGNPQPWKLNYVEIGNEDNLNGGPDSYINYRYPMFCNAITAAFPNITCVASFTGFNQAPGALNDYHIYSWPDDFVSRYHQSDYASAANPAMVGEYANINNNAPGKTGTDFGAINPYPTWIGSVAEVVYLLGLEVNAQTIFGASYAPTLENLNSIQWGTDMISFNADPSQTLLSTSWHTVKLLSNTRFTQTRAVTANQAAGPVYWAAGINEDTGSEIVKLATYNTTDFAPVNVTVNLPNAVPGTMANLTVMTSSDPFNHAEVGFVPVNVTTTMVTAGAGGDFEFALPNWAVAMLATMPKGVRGTTGGVTGFKGYGGYGGCKGGRARTSVGNGC